MRASTGTFAERLRAKQHRLGLSQAELAARLGVSRSLVSLVLGERRQYSLEFAQSVIAQWPEFATYVADDLGLLPAPTTARAAGSAANPGEGGGE